MHYQFKDNDLTSEKSLWDVYRLARRIAPSKFNVFFVLFIAILLLINSTFFENDLSIIVSDTRLWAQIGFNFSITTLGFLIAGFTIFATLSKPKMMLAMMEHKNKETGLPTLKYNFFAFMKVFVAYIILSLLYLLVILLGQKGGFIVNFLQFFHGGENIKAAIGRMGYAIIGSSFVYLVLLLKTFVFNIYAIVMNILRWEYHQE